MVFGAAPLPSGRHYSALRDTAVRSLESPRGAVIEEQHLKFAQSKPRAWCDECQAWHPRNEHIVEPGFERAPELRVEPRPAPPNPPTPRGWGTIKLSLFLLVILPVGVIAWSAAAYVILWIFPHIKAAIQ
jgi:hypothetical protein